MTQRYAKKTTVTVERSRNEIEQTLKRYGADQFIHGWETGRAVIGFRLEGYPIRMILPLPRPEDFLEYERNTQTGNRRGRRTPEAARSAADQAERQAWRALLLVLKAKLEAVEAGITTIVHEFLPDMILPGDITVSEAVMPQLDEALTTGRLPSVLPSVLPSALPGGSAIPLPPGR